MTQALSGLVFLWFSVQSVAVLREHGYGGFLALAQANSATDLLLVDVTIFVVLASIWVMRDVKRPVLGVPFVLLAAGFGAAGPLSYLAVRPWLRRPSPPASATEARQR